MKNGGTLYTSTVTDNLGQRLGHINGGSVQNASDLKELTIIITYLDIHVNV